MLLVFMTGCGRVETIELGGGYILAAHDRDHRFIYKREDNRNHIVIDQQIVAHRVIGPRILVHRMVATSYDCYDADGRVTIFTRYSDEEEFWIVNSDAGVVEGPLNRASFEESLSKAGLPANYFSDTSDYRSNAKTFDAQTAKCRVLKPS
jgi:hypothetical protein